VQERVLAGAEVVHACGGEREVADERRDGNGVLRDLGAVDGRVEERARERAEEDDDEGGEEPPDASGGDRARVQLLVGGQRPREGRGEEEAGEDEEDVDRDERATQRRDAGVEAYDEQDGEAAEAVEVRAARGGIRDGTRVVVMKRTAPGGRGFAGLPEAAPRRRTLPAHRLRGREPRDRHPER
jgi:hypothetical protein